MATQAGQRENLHLAVIAVVRLQMSLIRRVFRLTLVAALAASLGLAACGKKGPLDPPPGASLEGEPQANMPDLMSSKGVPQDSNSPAASKQPKKPIPLDVLLN